MGRNTLQAAMVALAICATSAAGRDQLVVIQEAGNELAAEYATCAAYYVLSSEGLKRANLGRETDDAAANGRKLAEHSLEQSTKLTSPDVAQARMSLAQQTMMRTMKSDYANLSLIAAEHAFKCKDLLEHPDERLKFLIAEKDELPEPRQGVK